MRIGIIFLLILSTVILLEVYQNQEILASPLQEYCEYKKSIDDSFICPNQSSFSEQPPDVIWYGPETGNYGINYLSHFNDLGLTFEHRTMGPIQNLNAKSVFVLFTTTGDKGGMGFTNSEVANMVNFVENGGQLILGADTNYAYCLPDAQCAFDFTIEKFGFKFGGDVQRGILIPEENNKEHPIWNGVYKLDSFDDWGFDAFIIDIIDNENIQVVSRVSSQSYNEFTGFTSVKEVPPIIVNENPSFNGGRVIAGGYNMIVGLGNISLLDNILSFVLDRPLEKIEPLKKVLDPVPSNPINTKTNSPKTQIKNGIKPQNISCTGNLILIFKFDNSPACVKPESIPKLIERGWAAPSSKEIDNVVIHEEKIVGNDFTYQKVIEKLQKNERVSVIVVLNSGNTSFADTKDNLELKAKIVREIQDKVLSQMPNSTNSNVKKFQYIPGFVITLDFDTLNYLLNSPDVISIGENSVAYPAGEIFP